MKKIKTNALRILDQKKINYDIKEYEYDEEHLSGEHVLEQVDFNENEVYKTLVLKGLKEYIVCCVPVLEEIDLKKLAKASNNKSVEMIHMKDLLSITGYIRGGCSPIGMKKKFRTYFQQDIINIEKVAVSAGKRGLQVILSPHDLVTVTDGVLVDVIRK
ncbi:MAG: Cys-tRNA(Pro) deacylase [Bacilli bacterium]|nr:Cys-tRNA(Pro) deacylase [Bacilli bacterium]